MEKIDFRKKYHHLYSPKQGIVEELSIPAFQYAMVNGQGVPEGSAEFQHAIEALYGVSYTLKFGRKKGAGPDYTVGALEGLWWMDGIEMFDTKQPEKWRWTLMVMQPDFITQKEFDAAAEELSKKKPGPALEKLRLISLDEGLSIQIMHIGAYDQEGENIQKLADYAKEHSYDLHGRHHEIYLGDPRRAKPEKLRTILRHPVRKK